MQANEYAPEMTERLLERLPYSVVIHDEDRIFYVNRAAENLMGMPRDEILKTPLRQFLLPEDVNSAAQKMENAFFALGQGKVARTEERLVRPDGKTIYVEISGTSVEFAGRPAGLIQLRELTSEREQDEFISIASHELKTPLTSLRLQIQILNKVLKDTESASEAQTRKLLHGAEQQIARLGSLVDQLVDVTKLSVGKLELNRQSHNLVSILKQTIARSEFESKHTDCIVTYNGPDELQGTWDAAKVDQIFTNLLNNALRYGAGKPVSISLRTTERETRSYAEVIFADRGIGIPAASHGLIFEKFEKITGAGKAPGLGLGLYIAREIARHHGGDIQVQSRPGEGSKFTLELPISKR